MVSFPPRDEFADKFECFIMNFVIVTHANPIFNWVLIKDMELFNSKEIPFSKVPPIIFKLGDLFELFFDDLSSFYHFSRNP